MGSGPGGDFCSEGSKVCLYKPYKHTCFCLASWLETRSSWLPPNCSMCAGKMLNVSEVWCFLNVKQQSFALWDPAINRYLSASILKLPTYTVGLRDYFQRSHSAVLTVPLRCWIFGFLGSWFALGINLDSQMHLLVAYL